jgi:hypothetical protein
MEQSRVVDGKRIAEVIKSAFASKIDSGLKVAITCAK